MGVFRIILISALLASCATSTPVGRSGQYMLECNGEVLTWKACFEKANKVCPSGYDVISQQTENGPYTAGGGSNGTGGVIAGGSPLYRMLTVKCH